MADFSKALPFTLAHEGGWANDPDDPGGATMKGITLATAQRHGVMTKSDLRLISDEKVAEIYRKDYWRYDGIKSQAIASKLFDMGVNMGPAQAAKYLQRSLNMVWAQGLAEDGKFGPKTLAAANAANPEPLMAMLIYMSVGHYLGIAGRRPASMKFIAGWLRRAKAEP